MKPLLSYYFYTLDDFYRYCDTLAAENGPANGSLPLPEIVYLPALPVILRCFFNDDRRETERFESAAASLKAISPKTKQIFSLPYIMRGNALAALKEHFSSLSRTADGYLLQNIGDLPIIKELESSVKSEPKLLLGDYALNITNSLSAAYWSEKLYSAAILPELPLSERFALAAAYPETLVPEIMADDNVIVMRSEHCYAAPLSGFHCGGCGKDGTQAAGLTDERGRHYPLLCDPLDCNCALLSPRAGDKKITQKVVTEARQKYYNEAEKFTAQYHRPVLLRYSFYAQEKVKNKGE